MRNKIKQLLSSLRKESSPVDLNEISSQLKDIKKLLIISMFKDELSDLSDLVPEKPKSPEHLEADEIKEPHSTDLKVEGEETVDPAAHREESLKELENIATTKTVEEVKYFLLHRPTENFEYANSAENVEFETTEETEWFAEYMTGEINQEGQNPVVSCWVEESKIIGSEKPHSNTGAWGELGKNPYAEVFSVIVKQGKYQIYQELRQRR